MPTMLSRFEMMDWLAADALVLGLRGTLDGEACQQVRDRLRTLTEHETGLRLVIDLSGVTGVERDEAENLFLTIVSEYARRAIVRLVGARGACQAVLDGLGISSAPPRFVEPAGGLRLLLGVTA